MEILEFYATNGTEGHNITFTADVVSGNQVNVTIIIIKENETIQLNELFNLSGENKIHMKWTNATTGNYSAVLIVSNKNSEARRAVNFHVDPKTEFMGKIYTISGINKKGYVVITPFEKLSYIVSNSISRNSISNVTSDFQYWSHDVYMEIFKGNNFEKRIFVTSYGKLLMIKNSTSVLTFFTSPDGYLETVSKLGNITENVHGAPILKGELRDMISFYNSNLSLIKERIESGEFPI